MIARIFPAFNDLAAACFPVAGCCVFGHVTRAGFRLFIRPPQPFAGPPEYAGTGATCYEALTAAVQLFHDTAHAYPDAQPLAAPGSPDGTPNPSDPF